MVDVDSILTEALLCYDVKWIVGVLRSHNVGLSESLMIAGIIGTDEVRKQVNSGKFETYDDTLYTLANFILKAYGECPARFEKIAVGCFRDRHWAMGKNEFIAMADYVVCCKSKSQVEEYLRRFSLSVEELTALAHHSHLGKVMRNGNVQTVKTVEEFGNLWQQWFRGFAESAGEVAMTEFEGLLLECLTYEGVEALEAFLSKEEANGRVSMEFYEFALESLGGRKSLVESIKLGEVSTQTARSAAARQIFRVYDEPKGVKLDTVESVMQRRKWDFTPYLMVLIADRVEWMTEFEEVREYLKVFHFSKIELWELAHRTHMRVISERIPKDLDDYMSLWESLRGFRTAQNL